MLNSKERLLEQMKAVAKAAALLPAVEHIAFVVDDPSGETPRVSASVVIANRPFTLWLERYHSIATKGAVPVRYLGVPADADILVQIKAAVAVTELLRYNGVSCSIRATAR